MPTILLAISLVVSAEPSLKLKPSEVGKVPRVVGPAANLPMSLRAPVDGKWLAKDGTEARKGEFLPYALFVDVQRRLRLLDIYPDLCDAAISRVVGHKDVETEHALTVLGAEHIINAVDAQVAMAEQEGWRTWEIVVLIAGVAAAGLAGLGVGALMWRG